MKKRKLPRMLKWTRFIFTIGRYSVKGSVLDRIFLFFCTFVRPGSKDNVVVVGKNVKFGRSLLLFYGSRNRVIFGEGCQWNGEITIRGSDVTVSIGENTRVKKTKIVAGLEDISIGDDCLFGVQVEIRSTDIHKIFEKGGDVRLNPDKPVKIGDRVWIASHVLVGKNTTIADGCVVGGRSVVTKDVEEENVIIAGNPAKIVRRNIEWRQ